MSKSVYGKVWFRREICSKCTQENSCDEDIRDCIEAEKIRIAVEHGR